MTKEEVFVLYLDDEPINRSRLSILYKSANCPRSYWRFPKPVYMTEGHAKSAIKNLQQYIPDSVKNKIQIRRYTPDV